jgi:hypothetical protein
MSLVTTGQSNMLRFLRNRNIFNPPIATTTLGGCFGWLGRVGKRQPHQVESALRLIVAAMSIDIPKQLPNLGRGQ